MNSYVMLKELCIVDHCEHCKMHSNHRWLSLRIDNCDEQLVYKKGDIFGPKGDTYTCIIYPKSSDFFLCYDVVKLLIRLKLKENDFLTYYFTFIF